MPYIRPEARTPIDPVLYPLESAVSVMTVGELNYTISRLVGAYLAAHKGYAGINAIVGILECTKLEAYRRLAAPYEDDASYENGDVYDHAPGGPRPRRELP